VGGDGNDVEDGKATLTQEAETEELNGSEGPAAAGDGALGDIGLGQRRCWLTAAEGPSNAEAAAARGGVAGKADAPLSTAGRARDADAG
jgi:hypothetical protein